MLAPSSGKRSGSSKNIFSFVGVDAGFSSVVDRVSKVDVGDMSWVGRKSVSDVFREVSSVSGKGILVDPVVSTGDIDIDFLGKNKKVFDVGLGSYSSSGFESGVIPQSASQMKSVQSVLRVQCLDYDYSKSYKLRNLEVSIPMVMPSVKSRIPFVFKMPVFEGSLVHRGGGWGNWLGVGYRRRVHRVPSVESLIPVSVKKFLRRGVK